jgi:hypothetical protein
MFRKINEALTKTLVGAHKYLHLHKDDRDDKRVMFDSDGAFLEHETNWGLVITLHIPNDEDYDWDVDCRPENSIIEIGLNPLLFIKWWEGMGVPSGPCNVEVFGIATGFALPKNNELGTLYIAVNNGRGFAPSDILFTAAGKTPKFALQNSVLIGLQGQLDFHTLLELRIDKNNTITEWKPNTNNPATLKSQCIIP